MYSMYAILSIRYSENEIIMKEILLGVLVILLFLLIQKYITDE